MTFVEEAKATTIEDTEVDTKNKKRGSKASFFYD